MTPTDSVIDLCVVFEHAVIYKAHGYQNQNPQEHRPLKPIGRTPDFGTANGPQARSAATQIFTSL